MKWDCTTAFYRQNTGGVANWLRASCPIRATQRASPALVALAAYARKRKPLGQGFGRSPVTLLIEEGRIADVAGNDVGVLIREFLESSRDSDAWLTSHMGWGLLETADWSALSMYDKESLMGMDARSYAGNFLISTGPNPFLDRWTAYHLDIPLRGCSIEIDGQLVVDQGTVVAS